MRINVRKFLFIGAKGDKEIFLAKAQQVGVVEFIHPTGERLNTFSKDAEKYAHAIKVLRNYVQGEQQKKVDAKLAEILVDRILDLKHTKDAASEEVRLLRQEVERIFPFGNFSFETIHLLEQETDRKMRFFYARSIKQLAVTHKSLISIASIGGADYFVSFEKEELPDPDLIEVIIPIPLQEVQQKLKDKQQLLHKIDSDLKNLTCYNWLLHYCFYKKLDQAGYDFAHRATAHEADDTLFAIQGWVPENKSDEVKSFCKQNDIFVEEVKLDDRDTPPTYLENKRIARIGEDLVYVFDTPSPQDKDPSLWLLFCFALFFAMIVGDAGYGLIFLATALVFHFKIHTKKEFLQRFLKLVTILSVSCVLWGFVTNSFFGYHFPDDSFIGKCSITTWLIEKKAEYHVQAQDDVYSHWAAQMPSLKGATTASQFLTTLPRTPQQAGAITEKFNDNVAMEMALLIGAVHIIFGLLRYVGKNPVGAGWIAFIIGAYLYLPSYLNATSIVHYAFGVDKVKGAEFGLQLLIAGLAYATIYAVIKNGLLGIFEVMTSIQIFSDVLSYLRIYALGMAGAIMSATINNLSESLPLFIAIIVMIFAHGVNIVLSIMGGTIHGLRLNYLEWYRYSFEGGGKRFKPLAIHTFE